jgi:UPF0755 protein
MIRGLARVFGVLCILAVAGAAVFGALAWYWREPGPSPQAVTLVVERGMGVRGIAGALEQAGVIESKWLFVAGLYLPGSDRTLKYGEYSFPAGASMADVAAIMAEGRTVAHSITIPEGLTSREVVDLLEDAPGLDCVVPEIPPEGSLLPETYSYQRGDSCSDIIGRMKAAMQRTIDELWPTRAPGLPYADPQEAVTLASIVEKETGLAAERPLVASVFVNRLRDGMRLQSDPTVIYAITQGRGKLDRQLLRSDWQLDSPYNTYVIRGLPPGPIANPGRAAIAAALDPAQSDYLFFVANGTGGHAFAVTPEEHNRNVDAWYKLRDGQGG